MAKASELLRGRTPLKQLILRAVMVVVLLVVQPFLWRWVADAAADLRQKRSEQQQQLEVQERINQIQDAKNSQRELLEQLRVVVPQEDNLLPVIERLQLLAGPDQHNVQLSLEGIERVEQVEDEAEQQTTPFRISIVASGRISNLLSYLHQVEHLQEVTVVQDIALVPDATGPVPSALPTAVAGAPPATSFSEPTYTMSLSILFFFQPPQDATAN